jgi:DNA-binding response OmpR family regulator
MMKKKILALEDAPSIQKILEMVLNKDYEIITKNDGQEGLEWLQEGNNPDLIISDVNMPNISGEDFLKQIKVSALFKDIPVIMLSGIENSAERIKMLKLGADDYMIKPFNPEELKLKIEILLSRVANG